MTTKTHLAKLEESVFESGIQQVSSDPGSPVASQIWVNTTSNALKYYNGSITQTIGASNSNFQKMGWTGFQGAALALGAGDLHGWRVTAAFTDTVTKLGVWMSPSAVPAGAKIVMGIYANSAGAPGSLLAQTPEYTTTGAEAGRLLFLTLNSSVAITAGSDYWLAYNTDNSGISQERSANFASTTVQVYRTTGYNATMANPFGAITAAAGQISYVVAW